MNKWYALHTDPSVERMVARAVARYSIETFLPEICVAKANRSPRLTPLFPGYLFIYFDPNVENPAHWRWVAGVRYVVSYGDWPVPVPQEVICLIQKKIERLERKVADSACQFKPGDLVRIKDGPFAAMIGVFDGPFSPRDYVHVLLCGLCNAARLRIDPSALEKVSESTGSPSYSRRRRTRGRGRTIQYERNE